MTIPRIRLQVRQLDDKSRAAFYNELKKKIKDPDTYAIMNYAFILGLHHCYLGKWGKFFLHGLILIISLALFFTPMLGGKFLFLALVAFDLYELFNSQNIVKRFNNKLMLKLLPKYQKNSGLQTRPETL